MSADAVEVIGRLERLADELEKRSDDLAAVERELEPFGTWYEDSVDGYEVKLWNAHVDSDLKVKLPPEALRGKLARADLDQDKLKRYERLLNSRKRLEQRIRDLRMIIEAQRSILSALKSLAEVG